MASVAEALESEGHVMVDEAAVAPRVALTVDCLRSQKERLRVEVRRLRDEIRRDVRRSLRVRSR